MPSIIVLQKRMMTLLLIVNAIYVVLGSISRLDIRQEAIVTRQKLVGPLACKHHIGLIPLIIEHELLL